MSSMKDVAQRAGVSIATVSHVVNDTRRVASETRQRVLSAVEELGFRRNDAARTLRTGRSLALGHLVTQLSTNIFNTRMVDTIERRANQLNYSVLLAICDSPAVSRSKMTDLLARGVDGVILSVAHDPETISLARHAGVPVVAIERSIVGSEGVGLVEVDQAGGVRSITGALIDLGHREIAFLGWLPSPDPWGNVDRERIEAFERAMLARGLEPSSVALPPLVPGESGRQQAPYDVVEAVLTSGERPTAVVATSEVMAATVLQVAYDLGLRVPGDLSVTGWGDAFGPLTSPPLTSVVLPFDEMAAAAIDLLDQMISGERRVEDARVLLTPTITWRRSVAVPHRTPA